MVTGRGPIFPCLMELDLVVIVRTLLNWWYSKKNKQKKPQMKICICAFLSFHEQNIKFSVRRYNKFVYHCSSSNLQAVLQIYIVSEWSRKWSKNTKSVRLLWMHPSVTEYTYISKLRKVMLMLCRYVWLCDMCAHLYRFIPGKFPQK